MPALICMRTRVSGGVGRVSLSPFVVGCALPGRGIFPFQLPGENNLVCMPGKKETAGKAATSLCV